MPKHIKLLKREDGATIVETLVALAFIGVVSVAFLNLSIIARKLAFRNRVQNELGQYAGIIGEELVKDYIVEGIQNNSYYCESLGDNVVGGLVGDYLSEFDVYSCQITTSENSYMVDLSVEVFGENITANRSINLGTVEDIINTEETEEGTANQGKNVGEQNDGGPTLL